ncbi:MAG: hypothetical protein BAJALOKI2v1_820020 [Promethearchaeota archaeon]|nr:MAG: hypothetical protein BAJALOKI2v1_820020 [Candidatus Lokiarchaeota archaeon]
MAREFTVEASLSNIHYVGIGKPIPLQLNYHIRTRQSFANGSAAQ